MVDTIHSAFVDGWLQGFYVEGGREVAPEEKLVVAVGTSNCGYVPGLRPSNPRKACVPGNRYISIDHGFEWAKLVDAIRKSLELRLLAQAVSVVAASDMQLAWNYPEVTRAWVDGYISYFDVSGSPRIDLIDFGSCEGCAYADADGEACTNMWCQKAPQALEVINGRGDVENAEWTWDLEDVLYKAWSSGVSKPVPEIYNTNGLNARQWYGLSLYSLDQGGQPIRFDGVLVQCPSETQPCAARPDGNTPQEAWWQLYDWLGKNEATFQEDIPWLSWIDYVVGSRCFDC